MGEPDAKNASPSGRSGWESVRRCLRGEFATWYRVLPAVLMITAGAADAQDAAVDGAVPTASAAEDVVVIGTRREVAPVRVDEIDAGDIQNSSYLTFADVLRRVPGVNATIFGQGDIGAPIVMRGFGEGSHGTNVAIYVDGVPQNFPSASQGGSGMSDMSWLTPDMIERVEVIKGPFSPLYGDQARGGVINIVTRGGGRPNSLSMTLGQYGYGRLSGAYSLPLSDGRALVAVGELYHKDGYRDHSQITRGNLMGKYLVPLTAGDLFVRANYTRSDFDAPGYLSYAALLDGTQKPRDRAMNSPPLDGGEAERYGVVVNYRSHDRHGWHVAAFGEHYDKVRANSGGSLEPPRLNMQNDDRNVFGGRVERAFGLGEAVTLTVGTDGRMDRGDAKNERYENGRPTGLYSNFWDLDLLTYGLFAQGEVRLTDALRLTGGVRHDRFEYDIRNLKIPDASLDYSSSITKPRGGIVFTPTQNLSLFANFGQGFRAPAAAELSKAAGGQLPLGSPVPDGTPASAPHLKPSTVESFDAGFSYFVSAQWQIGGSAYWSTNDDEIREEPAGSGEFKAIGDTQRDGWEIDTSYWLSDRWEVYASYAYVKARLKNPTTPGRNRITGTPDYTLKAGVAHTRPLAAGSLRLSADGQYLGDRYYYLNVEGVDQLRDAQDYVRYDVRLRYDQGSSSYALWGIWQPREFVNQYTGGTSIDPPPEVEMGVTYTRTF